MDSCFCNLSSKVRARKIFTDEDNFKAFVKSLTMPELYDTVKDCYRQHSDHLLDDRYAWMLDAYPLGKLCKVYQKGGTHAEVPYYAAWSKGLASSGYAASGGYAEKLTMIIETYQLWKIDYE